MGAGTLEKKIQLLSADQKVKLESLVDVMLHDTGTLNNVQNARQTPPAIEIKPGFGGGKGIFGYMADDFDAPLEEFVR
ncbi:MAG: hypothetical protein ACXVJD_07050 [Mucilaginibacter sp.]